MTQVVGFWAKVRQLGSSDSQIGFCSVGLGIFGLHEQGHSFLSLKNTNLKLKIEPHRKRPERHSQFVQLSHNVGNSKSVGLSVRHVLYFRKNCSGRYLVAYDVRSIYSTRTGLIYSNISYPVPSVRLSHIMHPHTVSSHQMTNEPYHIMCFPHIPYPQQPTVPHEVKASIHTLKVRGARVMSEVTHLCGR